MHETRKRGLEAMPAGKRTKEPTEANSSPFHRSPLPIDKATLLTKHGGYLIHLRNEPCYSYQLRSTCCGIPFPNRIKLPFSRTA